MKQNLIDALANMTVENGASPNEEDIAKRKMAQYTAALTRNTPKTNLVQSPPWIYDEDVIANETELRFREKWQTMKQANRKKWKI
jgi:hypothetical protein